MCGRTTQREIMSALSSGMQNQERCVREKYVIKQ